MRCKMAALCLLIATEASVGVSLCAWVTPRLHHARVFPHHRVAQRTTSRRGPRSCSQSIARVSMIAGNWWSGPGAEDMREMHELMTLDEIDLERKLPAAATCTGRAYLSKEEVLEIAREGEKAGCTEALFTLGDRPETRWPAARDELQELNHSSTINYLADCCKLVLQQTSLLPHVNAGVCTEEEIAMLRKVSVSQGLMLETLAPQLLLPGAPHHRSPDKAPNRRLEMLEAAGKLKVPFTTGLLIGIGESRRDRLEALAAIRASHKRWGHIQEVIIQPFRAKQGTGMAASADAASEELEWTTMAAVHMLWPAGIPVQTPPNLSGRGELKRLQALGVADWGGISPVTKDHVNPEAPWPEVEHLRQATEEAGNCLAARLPVYPKFCTGARSAPAVLGKWQDAAVAPAVFRAMDAEGLVRREETSSAAASGPGWTAGSVMDIPAASDSDARFMPGGAAYVWQDWRHVPNVSSQVRRALSKVLPSPMARDCRPRVAHAVEQAGPALGKQDIEALLRARGRDLAAVCLAADELRRRCCGGKVSYAVVRNINYTNMCYFKCAFCAFSKGKHDLRGEPYNIGLAEIARRAREAWQRGATEVCLQGGIHPDFTGRTYLDILRSVKDEQPEMHVHAFSALEVWHGASTLQLPLQTFLRQLKEAGLGSLPGTAAEVLDDEVRALICPDKITTREWLSVVQAAHEVGLRTTSTLMFGHLEAPGAVARHLVRLRALQRRTGGITEFVPLPFVHNQAPMYLGGRSRKGPSFREAVLVHAVARLALFPVSLNPQPPLHPRDAPA